MGSTKDSESKNQWLQKPENRSLISRIPISRWLKWHSSVIQRSYDVHSTEYKWGFSLKEKGRTDSWKVLLWPPYAPILTIYMHLWARACTHAHTRHTCLYARTCAFAHTPNKFYKREQNYAKTHAFTHIPSIPNTVIGSSLYFPKRVSNLPFQVKNHIKQVNRHLGWATVFCWCWQELLLTEQADSTD